MPIKLEKEVQELKTKLSHQELRFKKLKQDYNRLKSELMEYKKEFSDPSANINLNALDPLYSSVHDHKLTEFKFEEKPHQKWQSEIAHAFNTGTLGDIASAIAHEINQPLTVITTYSSQCLLMIKTKFCDKEIQKHLLVPLEKITAQANLASEIINHMKNYINESIVDKEINPD